MTLLTVILKRLTLKLAFLSSSSSYDIRSWSGIPYHARKALERRFPSLEVIETPWLDTQVKRMGKFERIGWLPSREPAVTWLFQKIIDRHVEIYRPDAIISVGAAHKISRVTTTVPVLHVADALFKTITRYYSKYSRLSARSLRLGERLQLDLMRRVDAVALASDWARTAAVEDYPWARQRIHMIPFGANLDDPSPGSMPPHQGRQLKLLFVGYDWERKGGPCVLNVFEKLRTVYPDAELDIVGCTPMGASGKAGVRLHGRLRKDVPRQYDRLRSLMSECSFLFMPSRSEAFGIIYCEACAFGLPSIVCETGGVTTIIREGENGIVFSKDAPVDEYAERIIQVWQDKDRFRQLQAGARHAYCTRLNWDSWAGRVGQLLTDIVGRT